MTNHPGQVTRKWRKARKLSIIRLSAISGLDKMTISRFENGGVFSMRVLEGCAAALCRQTSEVYAELSGQQPQQAAASYCPDQLKEHDGYHRQLEQLLHGAPRWRTVITAFFHAIGSPEGYDGGFRFPKIIVEPSPVKKVKKLS